MTSTNVSPSLWARCKKPDSARWARVCVIPCRSSRASMSFLPRESCERSRRPSGASGGAAGGRSGLGARGILADRSDLGDAAGLISAGASISGDAACGLAARGFFRSGRVCLAILSQRARSSSLKLRLRRGGADSSGIEVGGGRFIGCDGNDDSDGGGAHGSVRCSAALPAAVPLSQQPFELSLVRRLPEAALTRPQHSLSSVLLKRLPASRHSFDLSADPSRDRLAEIALRFSPMASRPAGASCGLVLPDRGSSAQE